MEGSGIWQCFDISILTARCIILLADNSVLGTCPIAMKTPLAFEDTSLFRNNIFNFKLIQPPEFLLPKIFFTI